jgi:hypothetical protein
MDWIPTLADRDGPVYRRTKPSQPISRAAACEGSAIAHSPLAGDGASHPPYHSIEWSGRCQLNVRSMFWMMTKLSFVRTIAQFGEF